MKKYGKGRERKTEIKTFDTIEAKAGHRQYQTLCEQGGWFHLRLKKKDEFVVDVSDLDDIMLSPRAVS